MSKKTKDINEKELTEDVLPLYPQGSPAFHWRNVNEKNNGGETRQGKSSKSPAAGEVRHEETTVEYTPGYLLRYTDKNGLHYQKFQPYKSTGKSAAGKVRREKSDDFYTAGEFQRHHSAGNQNVESFRRLVELNENSAGGRQTIKNIRYPEEGE